MAVMPVDMCACMRIRVFAVMCMVEAEEFITWASN